MFYVYMLLTKSNTIYTGYTKDVHTRYLQHCKGQGGKYTRANPPKKLLYYEKIRTKKTAMIREIEIKKMNRKKKLELINHEIH